MVMILLEDPKNSKLQINSPARFFGKNWNRVNLFNIKAYA